MNNNTNTTNLEVEYNLSNSWSLSWLLPVWGTSLWTLFGVSFLIRFIFTLIGFISWLGLIRSHVWTVLFWNYFARLKETKIRGKCIKAKEINFITKLITDHKSLDRHSSAVHLTVSMFDDPRLGESSRRHILAALSQHLQQVKCVVGEVGPQSYCVAFFVFCFFWRFKPSMLLLRRLQ